MKRKPKRTLPLPMSLLGDSEGLIGLFRYLGVRAWLFCIMFLGFVPMNNEDVINQVGYFSSAFDIKLIRPCVLTIAFTDMMDKMDVNIF